MRISRECFANLVADLLQDICASVACVVNKSRTGRVGFKHVLKFFANFFTKICRKTVVRREIFTTLIRMSYDSRATVLRKHANISRLSDEKIKLSDIRTNVVRRETLLRMSHDCRTNENETKAISGNVARLPNECLTTVVRQSRVARQSLDIFSKLDLTTENFQIFIPCNIVNSFLFDCSNPYCLCSPDMPVVGQLSPRQQDLPFNSHRYVTSQS